MVNRKGQAALADAIYFLLIVSGLSTFLFFFAVNYGVVVKEKVGLEYRAEYAVSALKTILYSSTPRIEGQALEEATEVDFLLAVIKEDFADNGELDNVKGLVVNNVVGLMEPISDSFNYTYYIYLPGKEEFAFFMLYASEWPDWDLPGARADVRPGSSLVYLCNPKSLDKLDPLITNVGKTYQANSRMQLVKVKETGGRGYDVFPAQVNLTMWISTALPETAGGNILDESHLNCGGKCFKKLVLKNPDCNPAEKHCETEWQDCS